MTAMPLAMVASGRGTLIDPACLSHLVAGRFVTTDLSRTRQCLEQFFGMECATYASGRMLARDRRAKFLMSTESARFFVFDIEQVTEIAWPQAMTNHWGFSVGSEQEVDRIQSIAVTRAEEFGFRKVNRASNLHGSYGFYFYDVDNNWWEVEYRKGVTNDLMFSRGDWDAEGRDSFPIANPDLPIASTRCEVLGNEAFLTHGTAAVADCPRARQFFEQVLRLRTVQQTRVSCFANGNGDFGIVGLRSGDNIQNQGPENGFTILLKDNELDLMHDQLTRTAREYGL